MNAIACVGASLVVLLGCSSTSVRSENDRIDRLTSQIAEHDLDLNEVEATASRLSAEWNGVRAELSTAAMNYRQTRHRFEQAASSYDEASNEFRFAAATWERARAEWDMFRRLIIYASKLENGQVRRLNCEGVSPRTYPALLLQQGRKLTGMDIDHIVPRSLGGADHPSNYQVLDSSLNRSLGATWNRDKCFSVGQLRCVAAIAVSVKCGRFRGRLF